MPRSFLIKRFPTLDEAKPKDNPRTVKKARTIQECKEASFASAAESFPKSYNCTVCGKAFDRPSLLKVHVRIHTRPFKCGHCGKGFSRAWVLKGHIRMHTGEKPYQCSTCGGAFADRSNLRQHLQTHSAVKNYGCGNCTRSFTRKLYLENHQKKCGGSNGKNS